MSLVFPERVDRRFRWKVEARVPGDGEAKVQRFTAEFVEVDQDELDALAKDGRADVHLVRRVLVGWSEVVDEDGNEVPFDESRREALIARPYLRVAVAQAYYDAILGGGRLLGN